MESSIQRLQWKGFYFRLVLRGTSLTSRCWVAYQVPSCVQIDPCLLHRCSGRLVQNAVLPGGTSKHLKVTLAFQYSDGAFREYRIMLGPLKCAVTIHIQVGTDCRNKAQRVDRGYRKGCGYVNLRATAVTEAEWRRGSPKQASLPRTRDHVGCGIMSDLNQCVCANNDDAHAHWKETSRDYLTMTAGLDHWSPTPGPPSRIRV
jgi:hypothetical protein